MNEGPTALVGSIKGGLAITDQLMKINCPACDLSDRPITDRSADVSHINLQEEEVEGGIRGRSVELSRKLLG